MYHPENYDITDPYAHLLGLLTRRDYHPRMSRAEKLEHVAQLQAHPLTAGLSPTEIDRLVGVSHSFAFPAHWTITAQSSCADLCYLILDGTVVMTHNHQHPRVIGPGDVVGLADAANHRVHYESAVSQTTVSGVAVEADVLLGILGARQPVPGRDSAEGAAHIPVSVALT